MYIFGNEVCFLSFWQSDHKKWRRLVERRDEIIKLLKVKRFNPLFWKWQKFTTSPSYSPEPGELSNAYRWVATRRPHIIHWNSTGINSGCVGLVRPILTDFSDFHGCSRTFHEFSWFLRTYRYIFHNSSRTTQRWLISKSFRKSH